MVVRSRLSTWERSVDAALTAMAEARILERILAHDHTVWKDEDREITNRLGWLDPLPAARKALPEIEGLVSEVRREGIARILLLGMGGSSLAPEVFTRVFGHRPGFPRLDIVDTTSPDALARISRGLDPRKTLFIVSSKSGTTAETTALFNYFRGLAVSALGDGQAGDRFIAITDPGSPLESLAGRHGFRHVFRGDPEVGGRFSALTVFGLVPAALAGVDVMKTLARSEGLIESCRASDPSSNPAVVLGAFLGVLARKGIDKATLFASRRARPLRAWLEQLIAESTGKEGKGILPVPEDGPAPPRIYGPDRCFIHIAFGRDKTPDRAFGALERRGFPCIRLRLPEAGLLPAQFYLWEMATAVAGHILGVNPFDQPDVEATKRRTREALAAAASGGRLESGETMREAGAEALAKLLAKPRKGAYVALQAFLDPTPAAEAALGAFRDRLREATRLPVTLGFGPRYLHSTGQLHKGDAGRGLFVQIVSRAKTDVPIPEVDGARPAPAFGALIAAQSLGDLLALEAAGRRVIRLDIGADVLPGLSKLAGLI